MAIEFHCPQCQRLMRTPDATAGKKGKCPGCGAITDIPARPRVARESPAPAPLASWAAPVTAPAAASDKIEFPCSQCGKPVRTAASLAGKKGKCPNCGGIFQIPVLPTPQAAKPEPQKPAMKSKPAAKPAPAARSEPRAKPKPAAKSAPGLTPLDGAPGLTPLGAAPGLVPLDDAAGLTPLNDSLGLTPLAADPLSGLSSIGDPFAGAGLGGLGNPYQSPAAVSKPVVRKKRRSGEFGYVEVLSCTWYTFWDNWGICLLAVLLLLALHFAFGLVFVGLQMLPAVVAAAGPPIAIRIAVGLVVIAVSVAMLIFLALFMQAGLIRMSVEMVKGKSGGVADVFSGAEYVFPLLGAAILQFLINMGLGFVFALPMALVLTVSQSPIVFGVYYVIVVGINVLVAILLLNMQFLIVDQQRGILDAISESASSMKDKIPVTIALFLTVGLGLIAFIGITLGIGLLLAFPFLWVFFATIYAKATGVRTAY